MSIENETADQVVKMVLQSSEVVLKLSGEATLRIATMIYNAVKNDMTKKGKSTLWEFMKSGTAQKLFTYLIHISRHSRQQVKSSDSRLLSSSV